jgi:hypothetical protein
MKRFYTGILKRNSLGTSYLVKMEGDKPIKLIRLNIKTGYQSGSRVVIEGRQNHRILEVDRLIPWPYPVKGSKKIHNLGLDDSDLSTAG